MMFIKRLNKAYEVFLHYTLRECDPYFWPPNNKVIIAGKGRRPVTRSRKTEAPHPTVGPIILRLFVADI